MNLSESWLTTQPRDGAQNALHKSRAGCQTRTFIEKRQPL